jgi:hypothetical protein
MANPESSDSPQVKFLYEWSQIFQTGDLDLIAKALHKDFRYVICPKSLGKPEETREEWLERFAGVLSLWTAGHDVSYVAPRSPFSVTKLILQSTFHYMIDTPGKVITHVRIANARIHRTYSYNAVPIPQATCKTKTSIGVEMNRESIFIINIVTDEDGSLKVKRMEEFTDSKAYLDFYQAVAAAKK